jgi:GntR family transcriptional regulator/MocR family aminotransferase
VSRQTNSSAGFPADLLVDVRDGAGRGVRERLEAALRRGIQGGMLKPGTALPPTRALAADLAIARSVIVEAYGNLIADGYPEARRGAGTWIRSDLTTRRDAGPRRAVPASHPDMLGAPVLRAALATYLGRVRGVSTDADRIVICSGSPGG